MNARLLIIDPQEAAHPPLEPMLVVEDSGVKLYNSGWVRAVSRNSLQEVVEEDVRQALRLRVEERPFLYLSPIRALPFEDMLSAEALAWTRQWWLEVVTELARTGRIADAPAVQTPV